MVRTLARFLALMPALLLGAACARPPAVSTDAATGVPLAQGERLIAYRAIEDEGSARAVAVVRTTQGVPEVRIYDPRPGGGGPPAPAYTSRQGDLFRNLTLEDVTGDGRDEILITWGGGHLELLEVIARGDDGRYSSIFQNAGREIEKRYTPTGAIEFWITGRSYEEAPDQPPAYETTVYRWNGSGFAEAPRP